MGRPLNHVVVSLLVGLSSMPGWAAEPVTIQSQSGQFWVTGVPRGRPAMAGLTQRLENQVQLDPALLAVSCEKIKRALGAVLKQPDSWRSKILIRIESGGSPDDLLVVQSARYLDRWEYRLIIPEVANEKRLVKTIVEVLLLEKVQRRSRRPVELPPWLGEGLAAMLASGNYGDLTLEPYTGIVEERRTRDTLYQVRQRLQGSTPLTLEELSWPEEEQRLGKAGEMYESCAHLFVHELLRLKRGRECLLETLRILPAHLNWQTAFFSAYADYFPRMLDLDKWWSLTLVQIGGRDLSYTWSWTESSAKLDEILGAPVQVRLSTNDLPMTTRASLQTIIREWDFQRQQTLLQLKLNHLNALRLRVTREMASLVDGYRKALREYLEKIPRPDPASPDAEPPTPGDQSFIRETLKRLDELDTQRMAFMRLLETATARRPASPQPAP